MRLFDSPSAFHRSTAGTGALRRRCSALLLCGVVGLLSGCGPDKPASQVPTTESTAQQEAGAPTSVVQANA
ncbi:TPA: hypothetical protein ACSP2L_003908, partial [Aeromonas veronii]